LGVKLAFSSVVDPKPISPARPKMITSNQIRDLRADLTVLLAANSLLPYYFPESALGDFGFFGAVLEVLEEAAALGACSILLTAPIATVSF
jgi:hypothetical protein